MMAALEEAERRARAHGIGMGVVSAATHTGAIGRYAYRAAERGLAAIIFNAGPPNMAYHGARVPSLATSPIAIGVPSEGDPLVLDMATSLVANGKLIEARDAGRSIPEDWALTKEGARTGNPETAEILLPLGGPKGSGLALMFECLTGLIGGNPITLAQVGPGKKRRHTANATIILVDVGVFRPLSGFRHDVTEMGRLLKGLPRLDEDTEILLPGERGTRESRMRAREGVILSAKNWARLTEAGARLGLEPPAVHSAGQAARAAGSNGEGVSSSGSPSP
jgi:ureidoglycolate dehydrogenase (NAD+)